jgi:hypothetical protein
MQKVNVVMKYSLLKWIGGNNGISRVGISGWTQVNANTDMATLRNFVNLRKQRIAVALYYNGVIMCSYTPYGSNPGFYYPGRIRRRNEKS